MASTMIKKSKLLKLLNIFTLVAFMFTMVFGAASMAYASTRLSDIEGHWAQSTIQDMVNEGIIGGYPDGTFKPNNNITRAEFASLIVRAFNLKSDSGKVFNDTANHWAKGAISTANYYGLVSGYSDSVFGPDDPVTREQIAVMIVNATKVDSTEEVKAFTDSAKIAAWAKESVAKATAAGLIAGYPDGIFRPKANATRAEAAVILDRGRKLTEKEVVATEYDRAGTYGPESGTQTIDGDVTISADGVILRNIIIKGNLIISEAVGDGDVTLNNVTVKGSTYIRGGGKDSIHIHGGQYNNIIIESTPGGNVRLVATNAEGLKVIISENAAGEEIILEGTFESVAINADNVVLSTRGETTINEIKVHENITGTTIDIDKNTTVKELVLDSVTEVNNAKGTVGKISGDKASDSPISNLPEKEASGGGGGGEGSSVVAVSAISVEGVPVVGQELTAKVTPDKATVTYQWQIADAEDGEYIDIDGATSSTYIPVVANAGKYIRVTITGTGNYRGTVISAPVGPAAVAILSKADPNPDVAGTVDWTRFAGKVEVADLVGAGEISAYYIFEITSGILADGTVLQYYHYETKSWQNFAYEDGKFRFGPKGGFDLAAVGHGPQTEFQGKIDGTGITGSAYLVEAVTGKIISNVVETTVSPPVINTTKNKGYNTIQAAIDDATAGDTIEVSAGTFDEALSIGKSLTILGVNADNDARTSAFFDEGSIVTGGIEITAGDVTIKGLTIETKGILASNITGLTVVNNRIEEIGEAMEGSPAGSIIGLDVKTSATGPIVINQNRFSGIGATDGTGTAIRIVQATESITITDNIIEDVTKNGINLYANCLASTNAKLTIAGNEISNWDSDKDSNNIGGRAIRIDFTGANTTATADITENKLIPPTYSSDQAPVDPQYVKLTSVGIDVDLTKNYWGSVSPDFETILLVEGTKVAECAYVPYYRDENMMTLGPPVINTTQGKGYDTIQAAVDASEDGDTIRVAAGTYSEEVKMNTVDDVKSITILGANAEIIPTSNTADGTVLTGGIYIGTDSGAAIDKAVTVKGITFSGGKGLLLGNIQTVTVENNKFLHIDRTFNPSTTDIAAIAVIDPYAGGNTTINNNYIDGVQGVEEGETGQGLGIYIRKPTNVSISANHVEGTAHNTILLAGTVTDATVSITGNKVVNWDSDNDDTVGGRALRSAVAASKFIFTNNCMVKGEWADNPVDPNFVKVTNLPSTAKVDIDGNYWNSDKPDFSSILADSSSNVTVANYYSDEAMEDLVTLNE